MKIEASRIIIFRDTKIIEIEAPRIIIVRDTK